MCATLSGCKIYHWKIEKSVDEIERIEIIYLNSAYKDEYDVIKEIPKAKYSEIINDIESLEAQKYFGELTQPSNETIRITFANGDFDLISLFEPCHRHKDVDYWNDKNTRLCFKKEQFNRLIEKWTTE